VFGNHTTPGEARYCSNSRLTECHLLTRGNKKATGARSVCTEIAAKRYDRLKNIQTPLWRVALWRPAGPFGRKPQNSWFMAEVARTIEETAGLLDRVKAEAQHGKEQEERPRVKANSPATGGPKNVRRPEGNARITAGIPHIATFKESGTSRITISIVSAHV
jgi:hypothetical protein